MPEYRMLRLEREEMARHKGLTSAGASAALLPARHGRANHRRAPNGAFLVHNRGMKNID